MYLCPQDPKGDREDESVDRDEGPLKLGIDQNAAPRFSLRRVRGPSGGLSFCLWICHIPHLAQEIALRLQ